jgi:hypothetical protein
MLETADAVESTMYTWMGQTPQIDRVYTVNNTKHFFEVLRNVAKSGKKVSLLIIAGHGSAEVPSIKLNKDWLMPSDVDPVLLQKNIDLWKKIIEKRKEKNLDTTAAQKELEQYIGKLQDLQSVSDVMAANANIILINCSTVATEKGKEFVRNIGNALLGKRGGNISASRKDVTVEIIDSRLELLNRLLLHGEYPAPGDALVAGDWQSFSIPKQSHTVDLNGTWTTPGYIATFKGMGNSYYYEGAGGNYKHGGQVTVRDDKMVEGNLKDYENYCCGNIGKVECTIIDQEKLHCHSKWWRPGTQEPKDWWNNWHYLTRTRK